MAAVYLDTGFLYQMQHAFRVSLPCPCGVTTDHLLGAESVLVCPVCRRHLGRAERVEWEGYIYVLSNQSIPDLLKIGFTAGSPEQRARELSGHTGVPTPYRIEALFKSKDLRRDEREVHERLSRRRAAANREFFDVAFSGALKVCSEVTGFRPESLPPGALEAGYDPWASERIKRHVAHRDERTRPQVAAGVHQKAKSINAPRAVLVAGSLRCPSCNRAMRPPKQSVRVKGVYRSCTKCSTYVDGKGIQLDLTG